MRSAICFLLLVLALEVMGQPLNYTVSNAHSHNDYKQDIPLLAAYRSGFGSIEADVFLHNGQLLVAHEENEIDTKNSLRSLYLDPLNTFVVKNKGYPFADTTKKLQLLVDLKSEGVSTLQKLMEELNYYPALIASDHFFIVITGNRPPASTFTKYPKFISFDGEIQKTYSNAEQARICLFSANLAAYTKWDGTGDIPAADRKILKDVVAKIHASGKPVRFWNAPDFENAWKQLIQLRVDFLNTDHIDAMASFLNHLE